MAFSLFFYWINQNEKMLCLIFIKLILFYFRVNRKNWDLFLYIHPHRHNTLNRVQFLQPIHNRHLAMRPLRVQITRQLRQNKARDLQCSKEVEHHRNIYRPNTLPRVQHTVQLLQNIHLVHPTIPQVHQPTVKNNSTRTMIIIR